ncbi:MAG: hypothetical protein ABEK36_01925 [Candidatus Aenigmatarchaeota archaeon]
MMDLKVYFIAITLLILFTLFLGVGWGDSPVTISGKVMNWENGSLVANEDLQVDVLSDEKVLASTIVTTNSNGIYEVVLDTDLEREKLYSVNVSSIDGKKSYVKKDFWWNG